MGRIKLECLDRRINLRRVAKAVYKVLGQKSFFKAEIVFQDGENMQTLNKATRGIDNVTDVLSYPSMSGIRGKILMPVECKTELEGKYIFLGSIVLCDEKISEQAKEYGHSEKREREYLIVHGLLHLFDYDHLNEKDKLEMRQKEKQIMKILYPKEEQ
ncbi:MAG: rRNA maturation RNase YbeY [Clostridia bacterium]|nr:rRNA maturation RNase YbeY [Clostridia bacterium]